MSSTTNNNSAASEYNMETRPAAPNPDPNANPNPHPHPESNLPVRKGSQWSFRVLAGRLLSCLPEERSGQEFRAGLVDLVLMVALVTWWFAMSGLKEWRPIGLLCLPYVVGRWRWCTAPYGTRVFDASPAEAAEAEAAADTAPAHVAPAHAAPAEAAPTHAAPTHAAPADTPADTHPAQSSQSDRIEALLVSQAHIISELRDKLQAVELKVDKLQDKLEAVESKVDKLGDKPKAPSFRSAWRPGPRFTGNREGLSTGWSLGGLRGGRRS
ncbi:hypothetical protein L198_07349 [Cryptococcus wingfieldii CBS 7118]|uniref:Uncharacterized protein n=1 Tax=Cryptococcus wingfieldii CBS 7118 TaxID=1295528 RepID=A0A1E3ICJ6_9TREE|nr:hypothetical protein L198_07349 [Cryptococcus wingfieldii CBS 7118]ODN86330.1 hypothetical protein L198_07349 [Cryptococcus wingfieldii CBS 7118]